MANQSTLPVGSRAPSFTLPQPDGLALTVPDRAAKGKTLVVFYKNTCPTCRLALPFIQRLHEQVEASGGRVVAVSQDSSEEAAAYARELGLTMPIVVDGAGWPVSRQYDLVAVPTLYLLERDGTIARGVAGFDKQELSRIAADLAGSVGAQAPQLYREGESVPDLKPG
jgi:peroxiredoxin